MSVWGDPNSARSGACLRRVFTGTLDARLIALDAGTGKPCVDFGSGGEVDLTAGMRIRDPDDYLVTSPPALYGGLVIVGSAIGDNRATDVERGTIRAFDVRSGAQRWRSIPCRIPRNTLRRRSGAWIRRSRPAPRNAWAVPSVDADRGLVFVPTGSASRTSTAASVVGSNRFANSLLALDAMTGKLIWHQHLVHHDLWDFDLAGNPYWWIWSCRDGQIPALLQATKTGMLFGSSAALASRCFPWWSSAYRRATCYGEQASATQPFPVTPALVAQTPLRSGASLGHHFLGSEEASQFIAQYRNEGISTPPDARGTILSPGYIGGVNWGGFAFDPRRQRVFAVVNHLPMLVTLIAPAQLDEQRRSGRYPRAEFARQTGALYAMRREPLLSPWGLPCTPPPWGTLVSVDLRKNEIVWQVPLGSTEGIGPWFAPVRDFGMPNMGGPIVTAGDLVFVGAAMDSYIRAFDLETGRELWKHRLPAGGQATPMTYRAGRDHRQFVVIAAGGHGGLGTPRGDYLIAFALPGKK